MGKIKTEKNTCVNNACHVNVNARPSPSLYRDGASDLSLATGRSMHLRPFVLQYDRAWITQSGDMETRGGMRGAGHHDFPVPPSQPEAHAALMCHPFTTSTRTSPHASPIQFHFGGERGADCTPLSPSRVSASQLQGRAARASKPHFVPISIHIQYWNFVAAPTRLCTRQCLVPSNLEVIMPNKPANGVLRTTDN
jgi:hypothetical protein